MNLHGRGLPRVRGKPAQYGVSEDNQSIPVPPKIVHLNPDFSIKANKKWKGAKICPGLMLVPDPAAPIPGLSSASGHTVQVLETVAKGGIISLYNTKELNEAQALAAKAKGNLHIYLHKTRGVYLDSKPFSGRTKQWMAGKHQVAGLINLSLYANAIFVQVGDYCVAVAHPNAIPAGSLVAINYAP